MPTSLERKLSPLLDLRNVQAIDLTPEQVRTLEECVRLAWDDPAVKRLPGWIDYTKASSWLAKLADWVLARANQPHAPLTDASAEISWKPRFLQGDSDRLIASSFLYATEQAGFTTTDAQTFRFTHPAVLYHFAALHLRDNALIAFNKCTFDVHGNPEGRFLEVALYRLWLMAPQPREQEFLRVRYSLPLVAAFVASRAPSEFTPHALECAVDGLLSSIDWSTSDEAQASARAWLSRLPCSKKACDILTTRWRNPVARLIATEYLGNHAASECLDELREVLKDPALCGMEVENLRREAERLPSLLLSPSEVQSAKDKEAFKKAGLMVLSLFGGYMKVGSTPDFTQGSTWHKATSLANASPRMPHPNSDVLTKDRWNRARLVALPGLIDQAERRRQSIEPRLRSAIEAAILSIESRDG